MKKQKEPSEKQSKKTLAFCMQTLELDAAMLQKRIKGELMNCCFAYLERFSVECRK